MPPWARIQSGVLLLSPAVAWIACCSVCPPVMRNSWAPCSFLPLLVSRTVTSPPFVEEGAVNFDVLPDSVMLRASVAGAVVALVELVLFLLLPHPAASRAARMNVTVHRRIESTRGSCTCLPPGS